MASFVRIGCASGLVVSLLMQGGCAGIEAHTDPRPNGQAVDGIRYYDTSPFLLIYTDGKLGLKTELHYLPDYSKKRSIRPYAYGASNKSELKFENGRLTDAKAETDATAIPKAVISALEKVAVALVAANAATDTIPAPYLFRIVKDEKGSWSLSGGPAKKLDGSADSTIRYVLP